MTTVVAVPKLNAYAVQTQADVRVAKVNSYAVLKSANVEVSKVTAYAILTSPVRRRRSSLAN